MSSGVRYEVRLAPIDDMRAVETVWTTLCAQTAPSFFLSWEWIGTWLECLPPDEHPLLLSAWHENVPRAACFLTRKTIRRLRLLPSRVLFINVTGEADYNLNPEYNGILASEADARRALLRYLQENVADWDEIQLPATTKQERQALLDITHTLRLRLLTLRRSHCYRVDLKTLRATGRDYRRSLSRNARYQLNRAMRSYARDGELALEVAAKVSEAHAWFDRMKALHTRTWQGRGRRGAFDKQYWEPFHRRLIDRLFPMGRVQMVRVRAGDTTIGYLYNLIADREVLFIQSGFNYPPDPHRKPGYVCHALAIEAAMDAGYDSYNFLAGDERYKRSLAREAETLVWLAIQRPRLRFGVENLFRRMLRGR